jgi:hypothetical protein
MNELSWNVYENKGPAFDTRGRSGNVKENKGGYALKAAILLKTQHLTSVGPAAPATVSPSRGNAQSCPNHRRSGWATAAAPPSRVRGMRKGSAFP